MLDTNSKKRISDPQQAYLKARSYCAYQERSQQEVRDKLYEWGLWKEAVEDILVQLIEANFLNEERFAIAYAGGKFRIKKWGKVKIKQGLKMKGVSEYCIKKAFLEIPQEEYRSTLRELLFQKTKNVKDKNPMKAKYKVALFGIGKGFESSLVWELLGGEEFE